MVIKGSIEQETIMVNIDEPNNGISKAKLADTEEEIDSKTVTLKNFSTPLVSTDRWPR